MDGPRHPKAQRVVESGLFDKLSTFRELEQRIAALPTAGERGDAFEVFAEAYLTTQAIIQADEVWPYAATPSTIRRDLRLGETDLGVDGIVKARFGEFGAYQVKFRTARPALTWRELSTFVALADYVPRRILFTNCDDIAPVVEKRRGFYCIRGSDLDRLEPDDFAVLLGWLQQHPVRPPKKTPRPDQHQAIAAICDGLQKSDRATAVMACGTGKTLVQLWSAERLGCRRILVLVPSLALLRQSLHVWLRETTWPNLSFLAVCSDPTVKPEEDGLIVRQEDLDFAVTTDSATVRRFLSRDIEGVQIVFSTYHSAPVVAVGCPDGQVFDLAIFDEAHWTAGRQGQRFSFALTDDHLDARKRLFMTATPRHYNPQRRDKEGDLGLVYSMDRPEVYGSRVYTLPFAEAAHRDIICGYKVIVSVVTSTMLNEELLRRGEVIVQGDSVTARQVANQIALRKAVDQVGVGKIITFHASVRSAESFTSADGEGIRSHLPHFRAYHVNGAMRAADRDHVMREFRDATKAVVSNARCLTEGVDVPAVDMVAFLAPRRSRVDIVQATGRAMRKSDEATKTIGYVFLPLYVQEAEGESIEQAIDRTDFEEVWTVLQALQEQDEVLADIVREMRVAQGRSTGYDDARFRDKVEILGPAVSLDVLCQAITTRCIERLAASWDYFFGKLESFRHRFGHCNVPAKWPEDPPLASWVNKQRYLQNHGRLSSERIRRLEVLGFEWDPVEAFWGEMFTRLVEFKKRFGHCSVPRLWPEDRQVATWVQNLRQLKKRNRLSADHVQQLTALGFMWDPYTAHWEEMFTRLVHFRKRFGNCNVLAGWAEDPQLAVWVGGQRQRKKRNRLAADHVQRLTALGFIWDPYTAYWEEMFARLVEFKKRFGNCEVPRGWAEDPQLVVWVANQVSLAGRGRLSKARVRRLDKLGFVWDRRLTKWEEMFARLIHFKSRFQHCRVPHKWSEDRQLAKWVNVQRQFRKLGHLSKERVEKLNALGFEWDPIGAFWDEMCARLVQYRDRFKNCSVPQRWSEDPQLANWVGNQRQLRRRGRLSSDRIQRLEALGFEWEPLTASWDDMIARLVQFKERFGHCSVAQQWPESPELGRWVTLQRKFKRRGSLAPERIRRLDEIGFEWKVRHGPRRSAR